MSERDIRDPRAFRWVESGVSGLAALREWDVVTSASCLGPGDECVFVALSPGRVVTARRDEDVARCLARALEGALDPPYRAVGVRRAGETWAVGAVAVEVAELPADIDGEELMLTVTEEGERELLVDGRPDLAWLDAVERLGGHRFAAFVLRAERIEGTSWEIQIDPL